MINKGYKITYREGDKVCFETRFPEFKYQPNYGSVWTFGLHHDVGLGIAKKIKGEVILINGDDYHVLVGGVVYVCKYSILKPVVKSGGILFFENKREDIKVEKQPIKKEVTYRVFLAMMIGICCGLVGGYGNILGL